MTHTSQAAPLPPQLEHRYKAFELSELKLANPDDGEPEGTFSGIASAVGVTDRHGEVIEKGAFDAGLAAKGTRYTLLWQHAPSQPIGVIDVSTDARGDLVAKGEINLETQLGREAHALLKQGAINAMSIGFNIPAGAMKWDEDAKVVRILAVDLWEVSLVTFPANPAALVDGVKQLDQIVAEAKAGRVLSAANKQKLEAARDALQAVLDAAGLGGEDEGEKSIGPPSSDSELDGIKQLAARMRAEIAERVSRS